MRAVLLCLLLACSSAPSTTATTEHWFMFDRYQFPGFYTPLFTLISTAPNRTIDSPSFNLSFSLDAYEHSILVEVHTGIGSRRETPIKLNIERADLIDQSDYQVIFIAVRAGLVLESYVDCKRMDSYALKSINSTFGVYRIADQIEHRPIQSANQSDLEEFFAAGPCKPVQSAISTDNGTIDQPLIVKMKGIIDRIRQQAKNPNKQPSVSPLQPESLTIVYKLSNGQSAGMENSSRTILNASSFNLQYQPVEHLFRIQLNDSNQTEFVLYADKAADPVQTPKSTVMYFVHVTPTMLTSYVNCELVDQEFVRDSTDLQNILLSMTRANQSIYDRQSTLILLGQPIGKVAADLHCSKLDDQHEEPLPNKLALRKFANSLDILVHSLDNSMDTFEEDQATVTLTTNPKLKISTVNIPLINGFGSLKAPPFSSEMNTETPSIPQELIDVHNPCSTNDDCKSNVSSLQCKSGRCSCPDNLFWSSTLHRCLTCHDLFIGNRCFRLLNHKLTWYQAHDYCQNDNPIDDEQEYTMKLASKLDRTDIESLKQAFFHQNKYEADYIYWIGATSYSDMRKLHQLNLKTRRQVPTVAFHWYDDAQGALIDMKDVRCPQMMSNKREDMSDNERCVGITSCGLYADDCQRNNRFICEAT